MVSFSEFSASPQLILSVTSFVGLSAFVLFFSVVLADSTERPIAKTIIIKDRDNKEEMEEEMEAWIIQQSSPNAQPASHGAGIRSCLCRRMF